LRKGTSEEEQPRGKGNQPTPTVAGFLVVEARRGPAQALFAEADTRLDGPAVDVRLPDDLSVYHDGGWDRGWGQPSQPDGSGWFPPLLADGGSHHIEDHVGVVLAVQGVPACQLYLSEFRVLEGMELIGWPPAIRVLKGKAFSVYLGASSRPLLGGVGGR